MLKDDLKKVKKRMKDFRKTPESLIAYALKTFTHSTGLEIYAVDISYDKKTEEYKTEIYVNEGD